MSASDQSPKAGLVQPLARLPMLTPPKPENWLELVHYAIHRGWSYSLQLVVLATTAALCVASVMFVVQLHADKWASVLAVAASVITGVEIGRLRNNHRSASESRDRDQE